MGRLGTHAEIRSIAAEEGIAMEGVDPSAPHNSGGDPSTVSRELRARLHPSGVGKSAEQRYKVWQEFDVGSLEHKTTPAAAPTLASEPPTGKAFFAPSEAELASARVRGHVSLGEASEGAAELGTGRQDMYDYQDRVRQNIDQVRITPQPSIHTYNF